MRDPHSIGMSHRGLKERSPRRPPLSLAIQIERCLTFLSCSGRPKSILFLSHLIGIPYNSAAEASPPAKMPAWWKGKSKSKSKSTASPRTKEPVTPRTPRAAATTVLPDEELVAVTRHGTKEKANSFDEVLGSRKSGDLSLVGGGGLGAGTGFVFGHPLPLPTSISSYGVSTGSASSVSSSSSSEETPDLGLYRYLVFLFSFLFLWFRSLGGWIGL
ncbi:hypothetical protein BHM03_00007210 [Ensete ventricosum]|nr:hypothetical protein BHM03_00007210 [Ensete ventricosum]